MTSKQNINVLASSAHVLKSFAAEQFADATKEEDALRSIVHCAAKDISQWLTSHFDRGDMSQEEWGGQADISDYNSEEQAIITKVAGES